MIDEVILMRHGRTAFNLERRLQGQIDIPLDIIGRWQADQSGYELASRLYWAKVSNLAEHPDALARTGDAGDYLEAPAARRRMRVVCSDLTRAAQTAHAFADLLGLDVREDANLRERSFGRWEGMTREEIRERYPEGYRSWTAGEGGEADYGVEGRRALGERGARTLGRYVGASRGDDVPTTLFVVTHGSWIAATIATLLDEDPEDPAGLDGMRNAFWSTMRVERDGSGIRWRLDEFNRGPAIAEAVDWENGPAELRRPGMRTWSAVTGAKA